MSAHISPANRGAALRNIVAISVMTLAMTGCMIPHFRGVVQEPPLPMGTQVTNSFPVPLYRLASGDVLEFLYLTAPGVTSAPYRLQPKDLVDVEFNFHPEMNRTVRVRPDGKISIPRKDDVMVAGLAVDDAKRMLQRAYTDLLRDPDITVTVREFNAKLEEIQKAITTAPFGQARVITVRPDGQVSLPLIQDVVAEGMTVPELSKMVNGLYTRLIPEMRVSVILKEVVGNLIFVDGEVEKPGVFTINKGPMTVQNAIAMAGGLKDTAEPKTVLVTSKGPDGRLLARTTNLTRLTSATDYNLLRGDLVYVPKSAIARADVWVDQNIKKLILFNGWSVGLQTYLGRAQPR
jgi:protein involved in polysaccharide export with SLBB domain